MMGENVRDCGYACTSFIRVRIDLMGEHAKEIEGDIL